MISQKDMMNEIMDRVAGHVADTVKDAIATAVERELTENLTKAMVDSEIYRKISEDMRGGLQTIYKEITQATRPGGESAPALDQAQSEKLFHEASQQLDEILTTTEQATETIMDIVEERQRLQEESDKLLSTLRKTRKSNDDIVRLLEINDELGDNLTRIMTALSFQDLTGQRIKKIIHALKSIETLVFDLYMSTGIMLKGKDEAPDKDLETLSQETQKKMSELKGPQLETDQGNVDDLLAQLGLE